VTAQIENPGTSPTFVNNGRVNVSQEQSVDLDGDGEADTSEVVDLGSIDARTQAVNNGQYSFDGLSVGPRGIDTDGDGIAEDISRVVFTGYQYKDVDNNQQLQQSEVNNATVETLQIAENDNINVEFVNATIADGSDEYAGVGPDGNFTVTNGVEYEDITLRLVRDDGTPVDLSDGVLEAEVALGAIEAATTDLDGDGLEEQYVGIVDEQGNVHQVEFDKTRSNATVGRYVIDDIQNPGSTNVSSGTSSDLSEGDTFVFDTDTFDGENSYRFFARTPDTTNVTATDEGVFIGANAQVNTTIVGVAGPNVPFSDDPTGLAHDQTDTLNTNVSDIETPTITDRVYRINATVTDALGDTPLRGSNFSEVRVLVSEDDVGDSDTASTDADVDIVATPDTSSPADDVVQINNDNGTFQYDLNVTDDGADNDGTFISGYQIQAQANSNLGTSGMNPAGESRTSGLEAQNPVVNIFGDNGGDLPSSSDEDFILANDNPNNLRLEAFPADPDGFLLPNNTEFTLTGSFEAANVEPRTELNSSVGTELATEGFSEGQIAFFQVTPTASGQEVIVLRDGQVDPGNDPRGLPLATDENGSDIEFDVLRSNLQVNVTVVSDQPVQAGENVTVQLRQQSNDVPLNDVEVDLIDPDGTTVATVITNDDGVATLALPSDAESGTYGVDVRAAGFAPVTPNQVEVEVSGTAPDQGNGSPLDGTAGEFDENGDGSISQSELSDAAFAFASGEVTQSELTDVAFAFASS
jgi:hypothetical protein